MMMRTTSVTDMSILSSARYVLARLGYELEFDHKARFISNFRTRKRRDSIYPPFEWEDWNAELGREDLAFLVKVLIEGGQGK